MEKTYKILSKTQSYYRTQFIVETLPDYNLTNHELVVELDDFGAPFGGNVEKIGQNKLAVEVYTD